jgi:hypothetical protein
MDGLTDDKAKQIPKLRERKTVQSGKDVNDLFPLFRSLVEGTGAKKGDTLIWAGCEGYCYSMATFFSYAITDLGLRLYFATDGDLQRLWRLESLPDRGIVATEKAEHVKARILVLMSGLANVPFEGVLKLASEGLADDGVIIGETVVPRLFEMLKWHEQIPIRYLFEFSMVEPVIAEMEEVP